MRRMRDQVLGIPSNASPLTFSNDPKSNLSFKIHIFRQINACSKIHESFYQVFRLLTSEFPRDGRVRSNDVCWKMCENLS